MANNCDVCLSFPHDINIVSCECLLLTFPLFNISSFLYFQMSVPSRPVISLGDVMPGPGVLQRLRDALKSSVPQVLQSTLGVDEEEDFGDVQIVGLVLGLLLAVGFVALLLYLVNKFSTSCAKCLPIVWQWILDFFSFLVVRKRIIILYSSPLQKKILFSGNLVLQILPASFFRPLVLNPAWT
jgi:hypothetical protein